MVLPLLKVIRGGVGAVDSIPGVDVSGTSNNLDQQILAIDGLMNGEGNMTAMIQGSDAQIGINESGQKEVKGGLDKSAADVQDYGKMLEQSKTDEKQYQDLAGMEKDRLYLKFSESYTKRMAKHEEFTKKSGDLEAWALKQYTGRAEKGFTDEMVGEQKEQVTETDTQRAQFDEEKDTFQQTAAFKRMRDIIEDA
jgi:hypothetical protein